MLTQDLTTKLTGPHNSFPRELVETPTAWNIMNPVRAKHKKNSWYGMMIYKKNGLSWFTRLKEVLMLLQNCNLWREAALHDRIILHSECTEQGKKIPPPFPPQIATHHCWLVQQPSACSVWHRTTQTHCQSHRTAWPGQQRSIYSCFSLLNFFFQSSHHSGFPKLNI